MLTKSKTLMSYRNLSKTFNSQRHKSYIKIVEVGPRDGLQNESVHVPANVKIELINQLSETGLKSIEVTSFVSPKWVPQMADNTEVFNGINKKEGISYPVLVPNAKGLESALKVNAKEIAVFASASDGFARKNTNCTAEEGVNRITDVIQKANNLNVKVRGYVSCVIGCPYDGFVKPSSVSKITEALLAHGCYEVSLGDTIGVGTKTKIDNLFKELLNVTTPEKLAIHCHDTYGQALANIFFALEHGVTVVDSSVAGLGGCPYAKGATGNVATEDLIYMLHGLGAETNIDLSKLIRAGRYITDYIKKTPASKVSNAMFHKLL